MPGYALISLDENKYESYLQVLSLHRSKIRGMLIYTAHIAVKASIRHYLDPAPLSFSRYYSCRFERRIISMTFALSTSLRQVSSVNCRNFPNGRAQTRNAWRQDGTRNVALSADASPPDITRKA